MLRHDAGARAKTPSTRTPPDERPSPTSSPPATSRNGASQGCSVNQGGNRFRWENGAPIIEVLLSRSAPPGRFSYALNVAKSTTRFRKHYKERILDAIHTCFQFVPVLTKSIKIGYIRRLVCGIC